MLSATDDLQPSTSSSASPIGCSQPCRPYNIHEILFATNFFDNSLEIGHGGYGKVYKGKLFNGIVAAIKRLDPGCGESQFWAEVETLSKLRHCNLVSLIGYCSYEDEMILVYEYMRFGTLADNLHKLGTPFSWRQLLQICLDAARGLDYLHTGTGIDVGVMHRDVKTSNILLHESWAAKISDFGLSILGPTDQPSTYVDTPVAITHGYVDLDYYYTGGLTSKCDVYNFGVVLLEVLCRKRAVDSSLDREELVLVTWAQDCIRKGKLKHIVDSGIRDEISPKCLKRFVQIVERCLHNTQNQRPTMGEVVCSLESLLILQGWYGGRSIEVGVHTPEEWSHTCRHFEYPEILLATNNFDESLVLGRGGYGKVYKGNIINGSSVSVVAIKRLDSMSDQGATEFWAEVEMLSRVHHSHLVSLFGYCNYEEQMILVYEHMPNGTLDEHLHKLGTPLSWLQRLKICIGVARGLDYLHTGTGIDFCIIHRDVKPSNIILHESCAAKLSDFGLSMIGPMDHTYAMQDFETTVKGTFGYLDPHYILTRWLTRKTDVFAFGVVLLEVLCRKCAVDPSLESAHFSLVIWAKESINEGNVKDIVDSGIRDQISSKGLKKFVKIVQKCLHKNPKRRPTMAEVVVKLESVLTLLQPAGKTIFGRMVDKLSFPTNRQNSAHGDSKLSSNSKAKSGDTGDTVGADNKDFTIPTSLKVFKLDDLERATRNFSQNLLLGGRAHREVFLGWVDRNTFAPSTEGVGIAVAVKKFSQDLTECQTVATVLGRLDHPNIISLLGYCGDKKQKRLLVYEYMQNKNLGHFLFGGDTVDPLSWGTRLRIMIGVARGLAFIHSSKHHVIHRNVKTSNILLDQDFNAKLGGFGSARFGPEIGKAGVTTRIIGTLGYLDPVYLSNGHVNVKSDIYSLGAVLLETLTGRRAWETQRSIYDQSGSLELESSLIADMSTLKKTMDPRLEQNYPPKGAFQCIALALRCSAKDPKDRPSSEEVLQTLEQIYDSNK